jgi:phosphomannomutase
MLRGDEVGALLGHHLLQRGRTGTYATTIVSSTLLGTMARAAGQPYVETLTGFKWIGRVPGLAFGYEEALGYCCDPEHVKDKDGVSALLLLCELAAETKAAGRTLLDVLDDLALAHGLHATDQLAIRVADISLIGQAMARLRATPPGSLGGFAVEGVDDLALGSLETTGLPPTDGLRFRLAEGARVVVRPSGTEPKLKCYLEVVVPVDEESGVDAARISAAARLDAVKHDIGAALGI